MSNYSTKDLRTIALVGHGSCGKTSLIEAMLYRSGMIPELGSIERGNTMCDNDALEKQVQHSIRLAVAHIDTAMPDLTPVRIHVLDTPGYADYLGQDLSALDAVKSVCAVVDATKGVELLTRRMMDVAKERNLCRMIVVNKFEDPNVDLEALLAQMQEIWGPGVLPINLPANNRTIVIDCFDKDEGEADIFSVGEVHRAFIEKIIEEDDETLERYFEEGTVDPRSLHPLITKALREGRIIPVCFVSAKNLIGIRDFMKVIIRHLPSPEEANDALFINPDGTPYPTTPDKDKPVIAQVFKVVNDPYIGKIGIFRVHQGTITKDTMLFVDENRKSVKAAHPLILQGKTTAETDRLSPGDIGALAKIDDIKYGSVLHSEPELNIRMRPINFPKPMFGVAIKPARRGDESRLNEVLIKMLSEDPTLAVDHNPVLNETVVRGLTEMHVRSVLDHMKVDFNLEVQTGTPSIPYRETIAGKAEGHCRHKKQTGGAGQFGEVFLRIEPLPRGAGFEFVDEVKGGVIPFNLIPAVEKGVREVLGTGFLAGYPLQDVKVTVYDGKSHPVDSKEVAFVSAARKAFLDALGKASPQILEPIVKIEIVASQDYFGDIASDLGSRRAQLSGSDSLAGGLVEIHALVPLSELDGYATRLHALTQGQGSWSMELDNYSPAPAAKQAELASKYTRKEEED